MPHDEFVCNTCKEASLKTLTIARSRTRKRRRARAAAVRRLSKRWPAFSAIPSKKSA
jgi:hypothetical protein